jgi:hypothetical protein
VQTTSGDLRDCRTRGRCGGESRAEVAASRRLPWRGQVKDLCRIGAARGPLEPHYTDEAGEKGILESKQLNPSLKRVNPRDARFGDGQYLSDITPGTRACSRLSRAFLDVPWLGSRFTHFVEIDVTGLDVIQGRPGVFVIPNEVPLDISKRIVSHGVN